jgi:hypothetical protein
MAALTNTTPGHNMRVLRVAGSVLATLVVLCAGVFAKHAPLPSELMQAKSVYIQNAGASPKDARESAELSTWGRFKLVSDAKDADVIFRLSSGIANSGTRVTSSSISSTSPYVVTIYVLQKASGNVLWSDSRAQQLFQFRRQKGREGVVQTCGRGGKS